MIYNGIFINRSFFVKQLDRIVQDCDFYTLNRNDTLILSLFCKLNDSSSYCYIIIPRQPASLFSIYFNTYLIVTLILWMSYLLLELIVPSQSITLALFRNQLLIKVVYFNVGLLFGWFLLENCYQLDLKVEIPILFYLCHLHLIGLWYCWTYCQSVIMFVTYGTVSLSLFIILDILTIFL